MKYFSKKFNLDIQEVYQRFILEEFARLISHSKHKEQLVLKGAVVVSTLLGFETRMTRDIDLTCKSVIYNEDEITNIIKDIINTPYKSIFNYAITHIKKAQEDDEYPGYMFSIEATLENTRFYLKLDVANNTLVYPDAIQTNLKSLFNDLNIELYTYHIENIIAEKFETTLDRGEFNGRIRDLFDIYFLMNECSQMIDNSTLIDSIIEVSRDRKTLNNLSLYPEIKDYLINSKILNQNFKRYKGLQYSRYAIELEDIFKVFDKIYNLIKSQNVN